MAISIDLEGRVILVCGVARDGIGGATARRIAAAGSLQQFSRSIYQGDQ